MLFFYLDTTRYSMKQYRLNINNVTYVRIDCEHIMVFRISISYIIINQNIMRHDAINHSLGEIDTFINHFAIRYRRSCAIYVHPFRKTCAE